MTATCLSPSMSGIGGALVAGGQSAAVQVRRARKEHYGDDELLLARCVNDMLIIFSILQKFTRDNV